MVIKESNMKTGILSFLIVSVLSTGVLKAQEASHGKSLDLSRTKRPGNRPVDSSPRVTGAIVLKPFGTNKEWPYLKSNAKEFRLETTDPQIGEQISQCEPGDVCTFKGDIIDGPERILRAKGVKSSLLQSKH